MAKATVSVVQKFWCGEPDPCDICSKPFTTRFTDGRTSSGQWANACVPCAKSYGMKLGQGIGQQYDKQPDGRWLKTGG